MLTPEQLASCADDIIELYQKLNETVIRDIVRRVVKTGKMTDTAVLQVKQLQQSGMLYNDIISNISKFSDKSKKQVSTLMQSASIQSVAYDNKIYSKSGKKIKNLSPVVMETISAGIVKTNRLLQNLTMTTADAAQQTYIKACTAAEMQVTSGAFSYQQAIKNAIKTASQDGTRVLYPSGHIDKIDVAVRRAVLTGVGQTTGKISMQNAVEMDCDLMEITAHYGARLSHAEWQGKLVSLSGRPGYLSLSDIGYNTGPGFKGWNCRHDWFPFLEGISERKYTPEKLEKINNKTVEYNGKTMTEYEAQQRQRAMERDIRKVRGELAGYDEAVKTVTDPSVVKELKREFNSGSVQLKQKEAIYKDFCSKTNRHQDKFRMQVNGFGKSVSQKAVYANKKSV